MDHYQLYPGVQAVRAWQRGGGRSNFSAKAPGRAVDLAGVVPVKQGVSNGAFYGKHRLLAAGV